MLIQLEDFAGESPRWQARELKEQYAQEAVLTKFDRRTLAPYRQMLHVFTTEKLGTMKTIYRFGYQTDSDSQYWFHWADEVSVFRSPSEAGNERTYIFGDGAPKVTDATAALSGGAEAYPLDTYRLGIPRPSAPSVSITGVATSNVAETRYYCYTYTNAWGEEGPPSDLSAEIEVFPGQTVVVDVSAAVPAGDYNLSGGTKKIYRVGTGESSAAFLYVDKVSLATSSYNDTTAGGHLGGELTTTSWEEPASDMAGAVLMPNGVVLAWKDNEIWPSEPFVPYAYPSDYTLQTDSAIVGIGVVGLTAIVVTKGQPYLITGVHPLNFTMEKLDIPQAGVARRAIVPVEGGVLYASPDGIVFVQGRQAEIVTRDLYTREDWQALKPSSMHAAFSDGRLFVFYDNSSLGGTPGGLIFDFFGTNQSVVEINQYFSAAYTDMKRDALFLCGDELTLAGAPAVLIGMGSTRQAAQQSGLFVTGAVDTQQTGAQTSAGEGTLLGDIFGGGATRQAAQSSSGAGTPVSSGTGATTQAAQTADGVGDVASSPVAGFWYDIGFAPSGGLAINTDGTGGAPGDGDPTRSWLGINSAMRLSLDPLAVDGPPVYDLASGALKFTDDLESFLSSATPTVASGSPHTFLVCIRLPTDSPTQNSPYAGVYVGNTGFTAGSALFPFGGSGTNLGRSRLFWNGAGDQYVNRVKDGNWAVIAWMNANSPPGTQGYVLYNKPSFGVVYEALSFGLIPTYSAQKMRLGVGIAGVAGFNPDDVYIAGWAFHNGAVTEAQLRATAQWMLDNV